VKYSEVLLKIEPLTSELNGLQKKLDTSQARVKECEMQLQELDASVSVLNDNFMQKTAEAESLKLDLKKAEEILHAAESLLQQLSGENERWSKQIKVLERELEQVPANSMVSAAVMTYLGAQNETTRELKIKEWAQMMRMQSFEFRTFMCSESQLLTWKKEGLPADSLSMENGIMILNTQRTPLIIDPATQASEWLKKNLKTVYDGVEVLNHTDIKFNT